MNYGKKLQYLLLAPLVALALNGCGNHSEADHDHDHDHGIEGHNHADEDHDHEAEEEGHSHEGHDHGSDAIVIETPDAERMGVECDTVIPAPFARTLRVSGEVMASTQGGATVAAPTSGIVHLASGITAGSQVRAGQTVATVSATNVTGGDSNQAALVAMSAAKRELDRVTPLLADGLVTRREYNEALAAYEAAKAAYSPAAASGNAAAPRAGVITSVDVKDGEFVEVGQPIATVAAAGRLTLRALVPAGNAAFLNQVSGAVMSFHGGQTVDIADFGGKLLSSAPSAAVPGYVPVFFTFDNTAPVVAGSAAEVYLVGTERPQVITVPKDAIVEQMGQTFIFVRQGDHVYKKRPVTLGLSDGRRVEILEGVQPGEVAVVKGATFVRLAEQASVAPEGHSHNH